MRENCWQARDKCKRVDAHLVEIHERVANNIKCLRAALERLQGGCDILRAPDFQWDDLEAERASRRLKLANLQRAARIAGIGHDGQPIETWNNLAQEFEPLANSIGPLVRQAGDVAARSRQRSDETSADRVSRRREDNRGDRRRLLCCEGCFGPRGENDIDLESDKLSSNLG